MDTYRWRALPCGWVLEQETDGTRHRVSIFSPDLQDWILVWPWQSRSMATIRFFAMLIMLRIKGN